MYEFHYKYIKNRSDAKLLFTDTDSLVFEIKAKDVYEDFYQDKNLFDFSDYPIDSKFFVLSKLLMYELHYKYIKSKYDAKLLFTDTDSLAFEFETKEDNYEDFYKDKNLFDLKDYPLNSKLFNPT